MAWANIPSEPLQQVCKRRKLADRHTDTVPTRPGYSFQVLRGYAPARMGSELSGRPSFRNRAADERTSLPLVRKAEMRVMPKYCATKNNSMGRSMLIG